MIKPNDLKDGMTVWYGNLEFGGGGRTIRNYPSSNFPPIQGTLRIQNSTSSSPSLREKDYVLIGADDGIERIKVNSNYYGLNLRNSFFATREELVDELRRILQTELDRRRAMLNYSEEALTKLLEY